MLQFTRSKLRLPTWAVGGESLPLFPPICGRQVPATIGGPGGRREYPQWGQAWDRARRKGARGNARSLSR